MIEQNAHRSRSPHPSQIAHLDTKQSMIEVEMQQGLMGDCQLSLEDEVLMKDCNSQR
jgi:hypothetical protein